MIQPLFRGLLSHSKQPIEGNLIIDNTGKAFIIPVEYCERDGHHLRIDSDLPFTVDEETIEQIKL